MLTGISRYLGWDEGILGSSGKEGMSLGEKATLTISPYVNHNPPTPPTHYLNARSHHNANQDFMLRPDITIGLVSNNWLTCVLDR